MSEALVPHPQTAALINAEEAAWTRSQIEYLKEQICPDINDTELLYFQNICRKTGFSPFTQPPQIYAMLVNDKRTGGKKLQVMAGIDAYRSRADATGLYRGRVGPFWCGPDGQWVDVWLDPKVRPMACKVGILHANYAEPLFATLTYEEWEGSTTLWKSKPAHMLSIRAETHALRAAFPSSFAELEFEGPMPGEPSQQKPTTAPELWRCVLATLASGVRSALASGAVCRSNENGVTVRFPAGPEETRRIIEEAFHLLEEPTLEIAGRPVQWIFEFEEPEPKPKPVAQEDRKAELKRQQGRFFALATGKPPKGLGLSKVEATEACALFLEPGEDLHPSWSASSYEQRAKALEHMETLWYEAQVAENKVFDHG